MKYTSTRDRSISVDSASAIKQGLSKEGGLFLPRSIPQISAGDIAELASVGYRARAKRILGLYLTDFTDEELDYCVNGAYTAEHFGSDAIAPLVPLDETANILELWHGPTCAFKDMALQILPRFLTTAMKKTGEKSTIVILVATSGDTGKAALEGFRDVEGTKITVFYPNDGVSRIQRLQMVTQRGENVAVGAVEGNFDDAQNGVKDIFTDGEYGERLLEGGYKLSSANSINWGRLVPQIVYYISAYCDMINQGRIKNGGKINICVPTGNFGNILAAYYAKRMGLPVNRLICASNANNILTDFINTGVYDCNRDFYTTISPSMDILISSNLERLLFELLDGDDGAVRGLMAGLKRDKKYVVPDSVREKLGSFMSAGCCDDIRTKQTIREIKEKFGYTCDTHTAVAVGVYMDYRRDTGDMTPTVIASTASPFKFNASVLGAIEGEQSLEGKDEFELLARCEKVTGMTAPVSLTELKDLPVRFDRTCKKEDMRDFVSGVLGI